jgi:hypothetical protein
MSVVFAAMAIPALASRARNPARGLRLMLVLLLLFNLAYLGYLSMIHPAVFVPKW